jgi:hypothetical protein
MKTSVPDKNNSIAIATRTIPINRSKVMSPRAPSQFVSLLPNKIIMHVTAQAVVVAPKYAQAANLEMR